MNVLKPNSYFFVFLLFLAFCAGSCGKKSSDPHPGEPEELVPVQELDVTNLGTVTVNAENAGGANAIQGSSKLIDNNAKTKFLTSTYTKNFHIQLAFPEPKQIASYMLITGDDADSRDPQTWTVTASLDGAEWVELTAQAYEYFPDRGEIRQYFFINQKAYKFYRFNIKSIRGSNILQLAELRLIQMPASKQKNSPLNKVETIVEGKNTLTFVDKTSYLNPAVKAGLINVFKVNYQRMADVYNLNAKTDVVFVMEPHYKGVAATWGGQVIRYDPSWFQDPKDSDVATHELMHVIQSYPSVQDASWVTEGIADYVRYTMGLNNAAAGFVLPNFSASQSYRDSYRVTARFFLWLESHGYAGIVVKLDKSMRSGLYRTPTFWTEHTGKTVEQLWVDYRANPAL